MRDSILGDRRVLIILPGLIGLALLFGCTPRGQADSGGLIAISHVNVVTMRGEEVLRDHTVIIAGGRVSDIGHSDSMRVPDTAIEIDGAGGFLMPGLWDMHTHIFGSAMEVEVFTALLAHGVTGVRDMNGAVSLDSIQRLKNAIETGELMGPTIVAPGPLLDAPGRSSDELTPAIREISSPAEAREAVRDLAGQGADFIKVYNRLDLTLLRAVLAEAKATGMKVVGHVPMSVAASELSFAGMHSQEHLQGIIEESSAAGDEFREFIASAFTGSPDRETIARFVKLRTRMIDEFDSERAVELLTVLASEGTASTPTLVSNRGVLLAGIDDELTSDPRWLELPTDVQTAWSQPSRLYSLFESEMKRQWYARLGQIVRLADATGVTLLAGTDLGASWVYPGSSLHDELELMVIAGLEPAEALATATSAPAQFLGLEDRGTIKVGNVADLVLLGTNPLVDIGAIRDIRTVVVRGRVLASDPEPSS